MTSPMRSLLILSLFIVNITVHATQNTTTNSEYKSISLPDNWVTTVIGELFYDTDFVMTDTQSSDMLIIQTFPGNFIINSDNIPSNSESIQKDMRIFNGLFADDVFLKSSEVINTIQAHTGNTYYGVFYTSQYENSDSYNYSWLGIVNKNTILLKIITKSEQLKYDSDYIFKLVNKLNYSVKPIKLPERNATVFPSNFKYYTYPDITLNDNIEDIDSSNYMEASFYENDRLSRYDIVSQCSQIKVPPELLTGVVMADLGYENSIFSDFITYRANRYFLTSGKYLTDKGDFHTISAVIEDTNCQHVLIYIVENKHPLVARFLKFIDHFETLNNSPEKFSLKIASTKKQKYAKMLSAIGDAFYALKIYNKSILFYQQALNTDSQIEHYYSLLQSQYNLGQYTQGLKLIEKYKKQYAEEETSIWKAWFLSKLARYDDSNDVFKNIFSTKYTNDEDFFKYLSQLYAVEKFQELKNIIFEFKPQVKNQSLLSLKTAQVLVQIDKQEAKAFIHELFENEQIINKYQFDLLDYLAEIEAYQDIVDYSKQRIEKGYTSAVLLNYLGDAQNMLGDVENAYISMQKAHEMAPENSTIKSYYLSLRNKVGISDLSAIDQTISLVELPLELKTKINTLKAKNNTDSYEYLYSINAFYHEKNKQNRQTIYGKIKINNDSGVAKNKTLKFAFNQQYEIAYINYFRVSDSNGELLSELDKSTTYITTDNDGITADDDKLINIPVPSLTIGVTIEYAVTIENKSLNSKQNFIEKLFVSSVSNQYKAIILRGDIDNVKVVKSNDIAEHSIDDSLIYWDYENLPNYRKTPYLPDYQEIFPWLKFSTVSDNWVQLGDEYLQDISTKINTDFSTSQVLPFFKETDDNLTKAKAIISFVQSNISYQAIEFGWRAFIPNTSAKTLKNKYGDCKDHAVLLHDMLNKAGIKAQLVLVNSENDISKDLPSFGQFDHMIVYLPEINDGVFVDVTDKETSMNLLTSPIGMQGHQTLVLSESESKLVKIPLTESQYNLMEIYRTVNSDGDNYIYSEMGTVHGYFASSFREYLKGIELDELESKIIAWVNNYYSDLVLEEFKYHNLYDNSKPLMLEFKFSQEIEDASVKLPIFLERYAMEFSRAPKRVWDFEFKGAFEINSRTVIEKKSKLKFKQGNYAVDSNLMKWNIDSAKKSIDFNSIVYPNKLPANEYSKFVKQSKKSYKTIERLLVN